MKTHHYIQVMKEKSENKIHKETVVLLSIPKL